MKRVALVLLASLIMIAAACGGDDGGPSRQEFTAEAKSICREADKKRDAIRGNSMSWEYGPKFDDPELLSRYNALGRDALERLRALEPPEEERAAFEDVLSAIEQSQAAVADRIAALRAGDRAKQADAQHAFDRAGGDVFAAVGATDLAGCEALGN